MSEIAFCVLPWPSAYLKSVTLGHLAASSLPDAVVTSRQLLPPNPSSRAKLTFFVPHQSGAPSTWVTAPVPLPPPPPPELPPLPQADTMSRTTPAAAKPGRTLRNLIGGVPSCEHDSPAVPGAARDGPVRRGRVHPAGR